jgi:multisubunit Na+/H+ antiporter MnhB subunit
MRRSLIVDTTARLVFHSAIVLSVYLLFAGHNQPGGGFVGGLVAGAAIAVHYLAGGVAEVRSISRIRPWFFVGAGVLLAATTAFVPVVLSGALLESRQWELTITALGTMKVSSTTAFDVGVYLVVVGLVAMIFEAFGEDLATDGSR